MTRANAPLVIAFVLLMCACTAPETATRQGPPSARVDPPPETPSASSAPDTSSSSRVEHAELAELLPRSLAGVELHTSAVGGDMLARLAATLGLEVSDVEVAFASEHGARFFQTYYAYAAGDVLFLVQVLNPVIAEEVLGALP